MTDLGSYNDPAVQQCPFPFLKRWQAEEPVYRDPESGFYIVTRYDDIAHVNAHPEIFSSRTSIVIGGDNDAPHAAEIRELYQASGVGERIHTLSTNDPPSHTRFRAIVDRVFTPTHVKELEPYIASLCDELIDDFIADGAVDLHGRYSVRLPMYVIADQLGVPRADHETSKSWSETALGLIDPSLDPDRRLEMVKIHIEMQQYLVRRQDEYRLRPADNLLSRLANAEIDGRPLNRQEFAGVSEQFLVAGNETTTSAIDHAVAILIAQPTLIQQLRGDFSRIGSFVEEVLRMHAPSPHVYRQVNTADVEIAGTPIPKGAFVMLSYLAGNYDEAKFGCPEEIDLDRKGLRNHLAFGRGIHYCLGNLLARAEVRIAIDRLLTKLQDIRFDPCFPAPAFAANYHVHALDQVHVRYGV